LLFFHPLLNTALHTIIVYYETTDRTVAGYYYVYQGGYVFIGIWLFVCLSAGLLNRVSQNLVERWHVGHRRNC